MSLIPFILDLADELQEYQRCLFAGGGAVGAGLSSMDIDDVDLSATLEQQLQQEPTTTPLLQSSSSTPSPSPPPASTSSPLTSRPRLLSQLNWLTNIVQKHHHSHHHKNLHQQHHHHHRHQLSQRHHPYAQSARLKYCKDVSSKLKSNLIGGITQTQKPTTTANTYPIIQKNGWMMVSMNVKQFAPDELMVKTIDNCIIVEGRHDDKEDIHGVISRHFIRKYLLPNGYDPNEVISTLSSDGILTVKAPPPPPQPQSAMNTNEQEIEERFVNIQQQDREQQQEQIGPAQIAVKQTATTETTRTTTSSQQSPTTVEPTTTPAAAAAATAVTEVEQPISSKIDSVEVSVDEEKAKVMAVDDEPLEALRETAAAAADTLLELKVADEFTTAVGVAAAATTAMECLEKSGEVAVTATEKLDDAEATAAVEEVITAPKKNRNASRYRIFDE